MDNSIQRARGLTHFRVDTRNTGDCLRARRRIHRHIGKGSGPTARQGADQTRYKGAKCAVSSPEEIRRHTNRKVSAVITHHSLCNRKVHNNKSKALNRLWKVNCKRAVRRSREEKTTNYKISARYD